MKTKLVNRLFQLIQLAVALCVVLWLLTSCSCQRRMERLRRDCPECFRPDTLRLVDTVVPEPVHFDQRIPWEAFCQSHTVTIEQPLYILRVDLDDDGLNIAADVQPDTIVLEREVPVMVPCPPAEKEALPWIWPAAVTVSLIALRGCVREVRRWRQG